MGRALNTLVAAAALLVVASTVMCGGSTIGPRGCVPGASVVCAGPVGCVGYQVCNSDGTTLGPCSCSDGGVVDGGGADAREQSDAPSGSGDAAVASKGDKIDVLFDIDNSASMGDKQAYLQAAIPDLVGRLLNPNCVDAAGASAGPSAAGDCSAHPGTQPEFTAVHDMHLGIVSSSLGARGGNVCNPMTLAPMPFNNVQAHNDDQGHLLNRSLTFSPPMNSTAVSEGVVADAPSTDPFLYWFPAAPNVGKTSGPGQQVTTGTTLARDLAEMVIGAGVFGCGIESQLESWYRFLVQPDPYQSITSSAGKASWTGVDTEVLRERHDFLRPDSVVVIVVLSDENDSEIDVRSIGGQGYNWMSSDFTPPRATAACATSPSSSACQSCAQGSNKTTDPTCAAAGGGGLAQYTAANDWGYDLNLRHVHMKAKYGIDVQFPIQRYVTGLTSTTVPDRDGEYPPTGAAGSYVGMPDCQNPLFAATLPDGSDLSVNALCHAPPGTQRGKSMVYYAHIGGVPNQLLHFMPGNPGASALTSADWVMILGNDPLNYDYSGIDPHMIESYQPRPNLAPPGSPNGADPINGHEWVTDTGMGHILQVDRQYACVFDLVDPTGTPAPRDCTLIQNQNFCDCPHTAGSVNASQLPPICDQTTITKQTGGKAYPTIRELLLAKMMGQQGVVSSICPIHVADNATHDDPLFGYRPAVELLVDRLKGSFK